jgi:hypothetical protein
MSRHPVSRFGAGTSCFLAFDDVKSKSSSDEPSLRRSIPACAREDVIQGFRSGAQGIVGLKQALLVAYSPGSPRRLLNLDHEINKCGKDGYRAEYLSHG